MTADAVVHDAPIHSVSEINVFRGTEQHRAAVHAIAAKIFDARLAAGITRKTMARRLGLITSTLWRKETGGTEFKASELVAIAKVCGVDVGRLLAANAQDVDREPKAVKVHSGG